MPEVLQEENSTLLNDVKEEVSVTTDSGQMKSKGHSGTGDCEDEFTFHPRVSSASARIVEGLGTDFLERQQRHVERQKKLHDEHLQQSASSNEPAKPSKVSELQGSILPRPKTGEEFAGSRIKLQTRLRKRNSENNRASAYSPTPPLLPPRSKTYYGGTSLPPGRKRAGFDPYANMDRLQAAKSKAEKAIKNKKIFSIHGCYPVIRQALRSRGWVEKEFKMPPRKIRDKNDSSDDDDDDDDDDQKDSGVGMSPRNQEVVEDDPDNKYGIMGRMVRNEVPMFQWTTRTASIDWKFLQKDQIVNHFSKANFTTKVGLCLNLRNVTSFAEADIAEFFPRCYLLSNEDEKYDFIDDFRLTAAMSIIQVSVSRHLPDDSSKHDIDIGISTPRGGSNVLPTNILLVAMRACELFIRERSHDDIEPNATGSLISEDDWNQLLTHYYKLVHEGGSIAHSEVHFDRCESILDEMKRIRPQQATDGVMNTWIVKPGAKSRGRGILVYNKLEEVLKIVQCDQTLMKDGRWVIQKYIERPLLIYSTKFDIRQWFLVTDWNPMTIYMYKECYLRFSGRPFTLRNLDPSIHLCNYSIQKNFEVDQKRHPMLPENNMWSCADFKNYLKSRGCESLWENQIYPGMRKAVMHICQTAQDVVEYRKNGFELYGADFMVDENFHPWLIEVNSSPTMSRSTDVTSRLCGNVQEDTLKVVLDRRRDRSCNIGGFELMHKQPLVDVPLYVGKTILVEGVTIRKPGNNARRSFSNNNANTNNSNNNQENNSTTTSFSNQNKPIKSLVPSHHTAPTVYNTVKNHIKHNIKHTSSGALTSRNNSNVTPTTKLLSERSTSPVKLKMQSTMKRLTSEVQNTPKKTNALNLPRFASQSSVNQLPPSTNTANNYGTTGAIANRTVEMVNKSTSMGKMHGGVHFVSTQHAKAVSNMGILPSSVTNYTGLVAAANRGSLHVKPGQIAHQQIIPKTFPSVIPGGDVMAGGHPLTHPNPPPGVVAVTPQTMHLGLPLQRLMHATGRVEPARMHGQNLDIYSYTSHQDFRYLPRQRVSGIYEWLQACGDNHKTNVDCGDNIEVLGELINNNNTRNIGINTDPPAPELGSLYISKGGDPNPQAHRQGFNAMPKIKLHLYQSKSFNKLPKTQSDITSDTFKQTSNSVKVTNLLHKKSKKSLRSKTQNTVRQLKHTPVLRMFSLRENNVKLHNVDNHFIPLAQSLRSIT